MNETEAWFRFGSSAIPKFDILLRHPYSCQFAFLSLMFPAPPEGADMNPEPPPPDSSFLTRWILSTFLGWLIGIAAVIVLAMLWDSLGIGTAQFMVGLGMGTGVGIMQSRQLRPWLGNPWPWIYASVIGMSVPFILADVISALGGLPFMLPLFVLLSGLFAGFLQSRLLRPHSRSSQWWIAASAVAWILAAGVIPLSDALDQLLDLGPIGALVTILIWLAGGAIHGVISGSSLIRILGTMIPGGTVTTDP